MIHCKIVTPLGVYRDVMVKNIHCTSVEGEMTILPNHMPVFISLKSSPLKFLNEFDKKKKYAVAGGFLYFENNEALFLVDAIEGKGDIDIERARRAYRRARERLEKRDSTTNMKRAELALVRAINRIHVYDD